MSVGTGGGGLVASAGALGAAGQSRHSCAAESARAVARSNGSSDSSGTAPSAACASARRSSWPAVRGQGNGDSSQIVAANSPMLSWRGSPGFSTWLARRASRSSGWASPWRAAATAAGAAPISVWSRSPATSRSSRPVSSRRTWMRWPRPPNTVPASGWRRRRAVSAATSPRKSVVMPAQARAPHTAPITRGRAAKVDRANGSGPVSGTVESRISLSTWPGYAVA